MVTDKILINFILEAKLGQRAQKLTQWSRKESPLEALSPIPSHCTCGLWTHHWSMHHSLGLEHFYFLLGLI